MDLTLVPFLNFFVKNAIGPSWRCTEDEVVTTKQNWLARCQYNVTGWVNMLAYYMDG